MNAEKQIEEMAEAIFQNCNCGIWYSEAKKIADFVINKQGYRKASEVAREIFEELEDVLDNLGYVDELDFFAIKKKWTEGEHDGN